MCYSQRMTIVNPDHMRPYLIAAVLAPLMFLGAGCAKSSTPPSSTAGTKVPPKTTTPTSTTGPVAPYPAPTTTPTQQTDSAPPPHGSTIPTRTAPRPAPTPEPTPTAPSPTRTFTVAASDESASPTTLTVKQGDVVSVTFNVDAKETYHGGLDFRSPVVSTGTILPGASKTVTFTAGASFSLVPYWPSTDIRKPYTIDVVVQ
jgi:hypothetical protein